MPRIARVVVPGYPHHVTQRGVRSMAIFANDGERGAYLEFMDSQCRRFGVEALAWCLMSNHVHLIVVPREERSLALGVGEAHRRYTQMKNAAVKVRGYLFQGRFNSCVLDEKHLLAAARYVELNPVRAGIVERPEEYAWSSVSFHLGKVKTDPLVSDRKLLGLVADWSEFLREQDDESEETVRRATRTGQPAGSKGFVSRVMGGHRRKLRGEVDRRGG
jgi:putative transposase